MRRSTKRLVKYVAAGGLIFILGPIVLKNFLRDHSDDVAGDLQHGKERDNVPIEGVNRMNHQEEESGLKKDWHNYKQIAEDSRRQGPGEQGQGYILSAEEEGKKQALYSVNGFNALASDKISLDRSLKDIRHEQCKHKKYLAKLPTVSVVVPFHNEHWSSLLRTARSVLNRSPPELLHEIILADDASTKEHCKQQLDDHLSTHYNGKVKVVRAKKREGLIRTRLLGAEAATGDVLLFLDSHVEANINWLPPLLEPIAEDRRTAVCPFIDVLDFETFAYRAQDEGARGAFDWEFFYKRLPLTKENLAHPAEPFDSPVMAGGLFAIDRKWFWELGGYDEGLDIWGGEQYELSFKLWQCHGRMVDAPCSRVGHVYRKFAPFPNPGIGDFVGKNYRRVAEVWMDEYAEYLYKRRPHYRNLDPGDLTKQKAVRQKLKCKPFKWFMEQVAFDLPKYYPPIEPQPYASGELRTLGGKGLCVDTKFRGQNENIGLAPCTKDNPGQGGEQKLVLSWHKDLRPFKRNVCFDASSSADKAPVILFSCHGMKGNQFFKYNLATKQLVHPISSQCLDCDTGSMEVFMSKCDSNKATQRWQFEKVNAKEVQQLWDSGESHMVE